VSQYDRTKDSKGMFVNEGRLRGAEISHYIPRHDDSILYDSSCRPGRYEYSLPYMT
jgi:hypothetical protein